MAKARTVTTPDPYALRELFQLFEGIDASTETPKWRWRRSYIKRLAQDQVVIKIGQGSRIDTYSGLHLGTEEDSQSDLTFTNPPQFTHKDIDFANAAIAAVLGQLATKIRETWNSGYRYSPFTERIIDDIEVLEPVDVQVTETSVDDISQWSPDQLASSMMQPDAESNMPRLREMILVAEDTGFSVEQSEQLAPWLLSFAERYRDSNDPQNESAVWSAIRTGASMLHPRDAVCLRPLLEPLHSIETSLVTIKMIGRIFEAQPPSDVDEYKELTNEVYQIAESLLNPHVITTSQTAAKAQLAIYALAAMASSKIHGIVKEVKRLNVFWFTQQTLHELRDLSSIWANRAIPVADRPQKLLERVIQALELK